MELCHNGQLNVVFLIFKDKNGIMSASWKESSNYSYKHHLLLLQLLSSTDHVSAKIIQQSLHQSLQSKMEFCLLNAQNHSISSVNTIYDFSFFKQWFVRNSTQRSNSLNEMINWVSITEFCLCDWFNIKLFQRQKWKLLCFKQRIMQLLINTKSLLLPSSNNLFVSYTSKVTTMESCLRI